MCIVCADMSGQFRRTEFLPEDLAIDRGISSAQRARQEGPLAFLDADGRGGFGPNGKPSLSPADAGAQITRSNQSWATSLGQAATVTYAYRSNAPTTMPSDTSGFTRFTQVQIEATELMLAAWSDVAQITFVNQGTGTTGETAYSDTATMLFGNYSAGQGGAAAFAYLPGGMPGQTATGSNAGNVWVNSSLAYNATPTYLGYGYQVLLHEIGHAIGLSHPADYNAGEGVSITYQAHAQYYEDSRQYTVMSYFSETVTGGAFLGRYSSAPLLDDIAATQRLYGANMTTRTGDTVYGFNSNAGRIWYDATQGGGSQAVIFAVWDAGGTDTLDFSGYAQNGLIDLRQGHFSSVGSLTGNVSIAMGAVIENAIGGGGADTLIGNSANNRLRGNTGNDTLDGGAGSDTAVYAGPHANYTVTAGTETVNGVSYRIVTVTGPEGTDILRNVESISFSNGTIAAPTAAAGIIIEGDTTADSITGTTYADWIFGAGGSDTLNGGDGADRINGGAGADTLDGGAGTDTVDYAGSAAGVTVNLTAGTAAGGGGADTLSNFENIDGTTYSDTLTGNGLANRIDGISGVDTLNGEGGNDVLIAGAGTLVGAPDVIKPNNQANLSIGTAVNIDANFDKIDDPGVQNATTVPHAVIRGTASGGGREYYAFTVGAGVQATFDIASATFDTVLVIFDSAGNQLSLNDDDPNGGTASFLTYTFPTAGTYYVAVGAWTAQASTAGIPPYNGQYVLNVSIPNHSFVEAVGLGSTLNGGEGDDQMFGGVSNDTFNGGNGSDTAVFAGNRSAWTITDNGGGSFTISNGSQTDTLTGVEFAQFADQTVSLGGAPVGPTPGDDTLQGSDGDDIIDGLGGNDTINGLGGNDILTGGAGADTLNGGDGTDRAAYAGSGVGVTARLDGGANTGGDAQGDVLNGIENLTGSAFNDTLIGSSGVNVLEGGAGNDVLNGGTGADTLDGGEGNDRVSYATSAVAVVARLDGGANSGGDAAGDTLISIENITGSAFNDILFGAAGANILVGGDGNDVLSGGAGADTLDGGNGTDRVSYSTSAAGVTARLDGVTSSGGEAQGDLLVGIENITGSAFNDILIGVAGANFLQGLDGDDALNGGLGADTLDGGNGFDRVSYSTSASAVNARLQGGASTGGDAEGDILISIESLTGSAFNDTLTGSASANYLNGYDGDDLLNGGAGADTIDGGSGIDRVTYATSTSAVTARLDGGANAGGDAAGDLLVRVENLTGTSYNDILIGSSGANSIEGGGGNDVINGGAGADTLDGMTGTDRVSYSTSSAGVTARLDGGANTGGDAEGDVLIAIEQLTGSAFNDILIGAAGANYLAGLDGDDVMNGGAGADTMDGGAGVDRVSYSNSSAAVTIRLGGGGNTGGHAQGDVLISIENVTGSTFNDILIGSTAANYLDGYDGNDTLNGGAGADTLNGGAGVDRATYSTSSAAVTVRLDGGANTGGDAQGDTLSGIEDVTGSAFDDVIVGSADANYLIGLDGADTLTGGGGDDLLYGGAGADLFIFAGASGTDRIIDFGVSAGDVIRLDSNIFTDFADVMIHTSDSPAGAVISKSGVQITLTGVTKAQLSAGDFEFAAPAPLEFSKPVSPQTLPGLMDDDPMVLPQDFGPMDKAGADGFVTLPLLDDGLDPLILPTGLESKVVFDEAPIICPTGGDISNTAEMEAVEMALSAFSGGRDSQRLFPETRGVDWIV